MDLSGWVFVLTFGEGLDIYAKDYDRVGIDRATGQVVMRYSVVTRCRPEPVSNLQVVNNGGLQPN